MIPTIISILSSSVLSAAIAAMIIRARYRADIDKIRAETETIHLENVKEAINIWRHTAEQLRDDVASLTERVSELKKENQQLKEELQRGFNNLERTIDRTH